MKTALRFSCTCLLAASLLTLVACAGPRTGRVIGDGSISYEDPRAVETVSADWGSTDLQNTAEAMTQSMLGSRSISQAAQPPRIRLREVKNYTDEHLDTKGITDKIRVQLLRSGSVRFLADNANLDDVFAERDMTEATTARVENDLMLETDYILTGAVRSIKKRSDELADVYYQITLELTNPQSGEIVWADEKEIRKTTEAPFFGW